jgi:hypothetical protein
MTGVEADKGRHDDAEERRRRPMSQSLSNAKRLLRDAKLLSDNKRYASAFALAVLGLEQIGKSILQQWNLSNYSSGHLNKQLAVSSLLIVDAVTSEGQTLRRGMIDPAEVGQPRSDAALKRIIKAAMESDAGSASIRYFEPAAARSDRAPEAAKETRIVAFAPQLPACIHTTFL